MDSSSCKAFRYDEGERAVNEREARSETLSFDRMIDCKIVSYMAAIITLNFIAKFCVFYDSVMQMSKM